MAKLVRVNKPGGGKALGRVGGKLITDAGGAPCCCGDCTGTVCLRTGAGGLVSYCVPTPTDYGIAFKYTLELISLFWDYRNNFTDPDGPQSSRNEGSLTMTGGKFSVSIAGRTGSVYVCAIEDMLANASWSRLLRVVNSSGQTTQDDFGTGGGPTSLKLSVVNSLAVAAGGNLDTSSPLNAFPRYPLIGFTGTDFDVSILNPGGAPCPGGSFAGQWASFGGSNGGYSVTPAGFPSFGARVTNFNGSPLNVTHTYSASLAQNLSNGNRSGFVSFGTSSSISGRQNNVGVRFDAAASVSLIYRWTVETLQSCPAAGDLPPGIDPETLQPITQPGKCAGCGQ